MPALVVAGAGGRQRVDVELESLAAVADWATPRPPAPSRATVETAAVILRLWRDWTMERTKLMSTFSSSKGRAWRWRRLE